MRIGVRLGLAGAAALVGLVVAALVLPAALPASAHGGVTPQQLGQVFDKLDAKYRRNLVGMCVGAVDSGIGAAKCYGTQRPGETVPPTPDTLFAIGSLTKDFTATL